MDNQEIWQNVGEIVANYEILECDRCAIAVMQWLRENRIAGKILRLRTRRRNEVFIICDSHSERLRQRHSSGSSITENGTHYGVEVLGKVFDNLSDRGIPREQWISSFHCMSEKFVLDELDSL
jgi:Papain fold toxin 2